MEKMKLVSHAGFQVSALVFPNGRTVELTPAKVRADSATLRTEIENWHEQWKKAEKE